MLFAVKLSGDNIIPRVVMRKRVASSDRREQIVDAVLQLLADTSIEHLTTRGVARAVGVSQPALFRHFRSRDALLDAVLQRVQLGLEEVAKRALEATQPLAAARLLVRGLVDFVAANPCVPNMLFHDASGSNDSDYRRMLADLLSWQHGFISELVREAQRQKRIATSVDASLASGFLIALLQGELLQARVLGRALPLGERAEGIAVFWWAGMKSGAPSRDTVSADRGDGPMPADAGVVDTPSQAHLLALDVRPIIAAGSDPLHWILTHLEQLAKDGLMRITAPFRPAPLLALLSQRGHHVTCAAGMDGAWELDVTPPGAPELLDYRDLPAPEPLERLLADATSLRADGALLARVPRVPQPLLPLLEERGLAFTTLEESDGTAIIHIRRAPRSPANAGRYHGLNDSGNTAHCGQARTKSIGSI